MKIHDYEHWCTYMYEENCLERHSPGLEAYPSKEDYFKAKAHGQKAYIYHKGSPRRSK